MNRKLRSKVYVGVEGLSQSKKVKKMSLEYYLLESLYQDEDLENGEQKTFGVEIVKKEFLSDGLVNMEKESVPHLFVSRNKIEKLIEDLSKHTVTPVGLYNVLEDMLGICY